MTTRMDDAATAENSVGSRRHGNHYVQGNAIVKRVGRLRFPVFELHQDGRVLASMGRPGLLRIMFGRGQRVELADGSTWRIRALGVAGAICPAVFDGDRRKVAVSSPRDDRYGLNGKDYGYILYPAEKPRLARANRWIMREHDTELAMFTRYPTSVDACEPVHIGSVLLAFTLMRHGILGESAQRFNFRWDT